MHSIAEIPVKWRFEAGLHCIGLTNIMMTLFLLVKLCGDLACLKKNPLCTVIPLCNSHSPL